MRIDAQNITIGFGSSLILHDVSLSVGAGEMVGLIGPNGAGKTSLLHVLAGLRAPRSGTVRYDGRTAAEIGHRRLGRRLSFLAQGGTVHWALRAEAVVELGRLPHRRAFAGPTQADADAIASALRATDTVGLRHRTVADLSGGERMRVLLARALAVEADVLVADEPTAALDPRHQLELMALLRDNATGARGVVVVLHDLALAARFCDRLILLANGRIQAEGRADHVLSDTNLEVAYGVEVERGVRDGVAYLLPWAPVPSATPREVIR